MLDDDVSQDGWNMVEIRQRINAKLIRDHAEDMVEVLGTAAVRQAQKAIAAPPTPKQEEILSFIREFLKTEHYVPSIREIGAGVGLQSSSTVQNHLDRLEFKGVIRRRHGQANRTIVIVGDWE